MLQVVSIMHEGRPPFEWMILAHMEEMSVDHVDVSLRYHSGQRRRHVPATVLLGDEWTIHYEAARRSREHRGTRTYQIDAHDLPAVLSQMAKVLTIARFEEEAEEKYVVPLGSFAEKVEVADSSTVRQRPRTSGDEGENSHGSSVSGRRSCHQ
jgi:hypothetical protein